MVAASRAKASDRAALLKKLFPIIKKHYKIHVPKGDKPVLETMLYAVCLEDSNVDLADASFKRLFSEFPDLNEVRVSTVGEIEVAFEAQTAKEWRAFRTISILKFVFDKYYAFEFESLRKKTLELATKQLAKIKDISAFIRDYTLHQVTGAHLIPIDTSMAKLLVWLGLVPSNQTLEQMGETIKAAVRKADIETFLFTLRPLATDPVLSAAFDIEKFPIPEGGYDLDSSADRLNDLFAHGVGKPKPPKKVVATEPDKPADSKTKKKVVAPAAKALPKKAAEAKKEIKKAEPKKAAATKAATKKGR